MSDFSESSPRPSELFEPCGRHESSRPSWRSPSGVLRHYGERLGFLRLWQIYFASIVVLNAVGLLFLSHGQIVFVFGDYLGFADAIFSGVTVWLIMRRKRAARPFVCIGSLLIFTASVVDTLALIHAGVPFANFFGHLRVMSLPVALYFFFSLRVRTTLTCPFDHNIGSSSVAEGEELYRPHDSSFWRDVAMFFMVFSVVGHWMELAYSIFIYHVANIYDPLAPLWRDLLSPFNIYGIGAVVCILLLFPLKRFLERKLKNIWLVLAVSYVANTLACTLIELIAGLLTNHPDANGHLIYWDYSNMPLNFMGQICLQNALCFGLAATFMVWSVFPAIERFILRCSRDAVNIAFVVILVVYILLSAFYLVNLSSLVFGTQTAPPLILP